MFTLTDEICIIAYIAQGDYFTFTVADVNASRGCLNTKHRHFGGKKYNGMFVILAVEMDEMLSNPTVLEMVNVESNANRLVEHLPTEDPIAQDRDEVSRTVRSAQFRQVHIIISYQLLNVCFV